MYQYTEELLELLKTDERFYLEKENHFFKNKITECGNNLDDKLIALLLSNNKLKKLFFKIYKIKDEKVTIFDREKFNFFINHQQFLPDSYTKYTQNVGFSLNDRDLFKKNKEISLIWPYKDCILQGGQKDEDNKRNEVFYNEVLAPEQIDRLLDKKVFTNFKKYTKDGEKKLTEIKDITKENLIIKGNNLLALHSLKSIYRKKVKLIYIDPPYNTGNDSFKYNDNFNHSTWLTFIKNRLEIAKELLSDDGVIFVQCDDNEQAYLKVLMDEVFDDGSFISNIAIKAKSSAGASGGGEDKKLKKNYENLIVFSKKDFLGFKKIYKQEYLEDILIKKQRDKKIYEYNKVFQNKGNKIKYGSIKLGTGENIDVFKHENYVIDTINNISKNEEFTIYKSYLKYFNKVFRTQDAQSSIRYKVVNATNRDGGLYSIIYKPISGKNKNKKTELFYYKNEMVNFFTNVAEVKSDSIIKNTIIGSLWEDISWDGISNEGSIKFKSGKKPEKLLERIINMSTKPTDIVLDFFLGSGTTCAVAHKMGRKYIGIEQMDYIEDITLKRMKKVIGQKVKKEGELLETMEYDQGGISKSVKWQGGGDFIYLELAEYNQKFMNNIELAKNSDGLLEVYENIQKNGFLSYQFKEKEFLEQTADFKNLSLNEQKRFLCEILDKNMLYLNFDDIEDKKYNLSKEDIKLNKEFYKNNIE